MMNLVKKQGIGTWISLGTLLLAIIGLILYGASVSGGMDLTVANGSEPFYEASRTADATMLKMVVTCGVLSVLFLAGAIVLGQLKLEGLVGTIVNAVSGAMRIIVPALLLATLLNYLYGSLTGLAWTLFSNEELEIYAEAIKVGNTVITGVVFLAISMIASVVATFFGLTKKTTE